MKKREKKNTTISLWLFIFTLVIAIGNLNNYIWSDTSENLIFTGNYFISFYIFIAGYFLMKHYKNNSDDSKPSLKAWKYTKMNFSYFYPALLGGVVLAFIVRNALKGIELSKITSVFMNSIWEFLGIAQLGSTTLWNQPLWIISTIVVAGLILYYLVSYNEDMFRGLIAPLLIIFIYFGFGLSNNFLRVIAGMTLGMLMYYIVEYFGKKKFKENMTMFFSIIHMGLVMIFIYTIYNGTSWNELTNGLLVYVFCIILLTNKDYICALYNDSKICSFLGNISLYYYVCHIAFAYLLNGFFPEMTYHASIIFNILFTLCWSFIMKYIDDYVITPLFRSEKTIKKDCL